MTEEDKSNTTSSEPEIAEVEQSASEMFTNSKVLAELAECKDKYLRLLAESENMRKRMSKEKQESIRYAMDSLFAELLDPIDNFENALKYAQGDNVSSEVKNWALGFTMILGKFKDVLSQNGIVEFLSVGTAFDPHKHQAVEVEETNDHKEGMIIEEFVKGYSSQDRIIRPARVKVASKKKEPLQEPQ